MFISSSGTNGNERKENAPRRELFDVSLISIASSPLNLDHLIIATERNVSTAGAERVKVIPVLSLDLRNQTRERACPVLSHEMDSQNELKGPSNLKEY